MADEAFIAHLLRRTSFGPFPGQVEKLAPGGIAAAIDSVLAATPPKFAITGSYRNPNTDSLTRKWLKQMANPKAGLTEKMTWFWHGHFTSAGQKVGSDQLIATQYNLFRKNALGNFRALAQAVTIDGAMLRYLDGDGSTIDAPNENFAREVQELFTIGHNNVTQANVVSAAKAFSGWYVDNTGSHFDPSSGNSTPVPLVFGTTTVNVTNASDVINALCDHPACAPFIVGKLYAYIAGTAPAPATLSQLVGVFTANNLEVRPVVEAIVRDPAFLNQRMNRPRYPVEWLSAARMATGVADGKTLTQACQDLGQTPFEPPNVAGWQPGTRWLSASAILAKASYLRNTKVIGAIANAVDPVAATLTRCQLYEMTTETMDALTNFAASVSDRKKLAMGLLALTLASPEFALA